MISPKSNSYLIIRLEFEPRQFDHQNPTSRAFSQTECVLQHIDSTCASLSATYFVFVF